MLTIWLGMGEDPTVLRSTKEQKAKCIAPKQKARAVAHLAPSNSPSKALQGIEYERWNVFQALNKLMERNIRKLPPYQVRFPTSSSCQSPL